MQTKTLSVKLPVELLRALRIRAAETDTTIQSLLEKLLTRSLGKSRG